MIASKSKKTAETPSSSVLNTSSSDNQESALVAGTTSIKESENNISTKGGVTGRLRLPTAPKTLPPRMIKGASQLSFATKQKIRARPQEYAYSATASFQEIARLISLNDEQKQFIVKLQNEIKTLKIVNARQEKGLRSMDRDQDDFPKLFKNMNEELRVAKIDRLRALEKIASLEKQALSKAAEHHRQQTKIKELKEKLKKNTNPDFEALNRELLEKNQQLESFNSKLDELNAQIKTLTAERNREISFAKQKHSKLSKELEDAKHETLRLNTALKEKERTVNTLSMYSRRSNISESEDEGTNTSYKTGKSKKLHKERLNPIADDDRSGAEATPVIPISLAARPESAPKSAKSRSQSANKLNSLGLVAPTTSGGKWQQSSEGALAHQRNASYPISTDISRGATPAKPGQHVEIEVDTTHQRVTSYPFTTNNSRGASPAKPMKPVSPFAKAAATNLEPAKTFSFFKPNLNNLKAKSVTSETQPLLSDGEYSEDFHHDDD